MKSIRRALVSVALASLALVGCASPTAAPSHSITACAEEDSTNCFWDASKRGNGEGRSFFVNVDGKRYYVDDMRAECEAGAREVCDSLSLNLPHMKGNS